MWFDAQLDQKILDGFYSSRKTKQILNSHEFFNHSYGLDEKPQYHINKHDPFQLVQKIRFLQKHLW